MSVIELQSAGANPHIESCSICNQYLNDMLSISDGLGALVIPRPTGMHQPVKQLHGRNKLLTLIAAVLLMLLVGTMVAYVVSGYYVENPDTSGTRKAVFADPGPPKTAVTPPNAR